MRLTELLFVEDNFSINYTISLLEQVLSRKEAKGSTGVYHYKVSDDLPTGSESLEDLANLLKSEVSVRCVDVVALAGTEEADFFNGIREKIAPVAIVTPMRLLYSGQGLTDKEKEQAAGLMDALKSRSAKHHMSKQALKSIFAIAIKKLFTETKSREVLMSPALRDAIIIPIPSSAPLSADFAKMVATEINTNYKGSTQLLNVFEKRSPKAHKQITNVSGKSNADIDPRKSLKTHQQLVDIINKDIVKITQEIEQVEGKHEEFSNIMNNQTMSIKDKLDLVYRSVDSGSLPYAKKFYYEKHLKLLWAEYEKNVNLLASGEDIHTFQIKTARGAVKRSLYDYIKVKPQDTKQMAALNGKLVILVDDNVDSNSTLAEAIKEIYRNNVYPSKIVAIAPHRLMGKGGVETEV